MPGAGIATRAWQPPPAVPRGGGPAPALPWTRSGGGPAPHSLYKTAPPDTRFPGGAAVPASRPACKSDTSLMTQCQTCRLRSRRGRFATPAGNLRLLAGLSRGGDRARGLWCTGKRLLSVTTELEYPLGGSRTVVPWPVLPGCYGAGSLRGEPLRVGVQGGLCPPWKARPRRPADGDAQLFRQYLTESSAILPRLGGRLPLY